LLLRFGPFTTRFADVFLLLCAYLVMCRHVNIFIYYPSYSRLPTAFPFLYPSWYHIRCTSVFSSNSRTFDTALDEGRGPPRKPDYEDSRRDNDRGSYRSSEREYFTSKPKRGYDDRDRDRDGDRFRERERSYDGPRDNTYSRDRFYNDKNDARIRYSRVSEMGVFVLPKPTIRERSSSLNIGQGQGFQQDRARDGDSSLSTPHGDVIEAKDVDNSDDRFAYSGGNDGDTYYRRGPHAESPFVDTDNVDEGAGHYESR